MPLKPRLKPARRQKRRQLKRRLTAETPWKDLLPREKRLKLSDELRSKSSKSVAGLPKKPPARSKKKLCAKSKRKRISSAVKRKIGVPKWRQIVRDGSKTNLHRGKLTAKRERRESSRIKESLSASGKSVLVKPRSKKSSKRSSSSSPVFKMQSPPERQACTRKRVTSLTLMRIT